MPTAATWYFSYAPHDLAAACWAALAGLFIGSFLNVIIYRLPEMMRRSNDNYVAEEQGLPPPHATRYDLLLPRSHCPGCGATLSIRHNIPLLSFVFLRGRCAGCGNPISLRYPLVELLAAGLSAILIWHFGSGVRGMSALLLMYFLLAMAWIDAETGLLPDSLTLPLIWGGLLVNLNGLIVPLRDAVLGALAGYLMLWLVFQLYRLAAGKEGMGYGDFKLLAALGAWLGWSMLPVILLLASISGLMVGIALQLSGKRRAGAMLPFGPFLAAGGLFSLFYGPLIWQIYLRWMLPA
ncbi:prepilin peptidase [Oxalobacteraceae bacterium CAVE-383]|nr:prepilin peptidase [Oxalobacteraceae bacterium CAVE-383]